MTQFKPVVTKNSKITRIAVDGRVYIKWAAIGRWEVYKVDRKGRETFSHYHGVSDDATLETIALLG